MQAGQTPEYWNSYWRAGGDAAYAADGPLQSLLDRFWAAIVPRSMSTDPLLVLDIAAGTGAASRALSRGAKPGEVMPVLCDLSWHALQSAQSVAPGVLANATHLPFRSASFDLAISQYGLEYAGTTALQEAARVTKSQGLIVLLIHHKQGALQAENERNLAAAQAFVESGALPAFSRFAGAGDSLSRSRTESDFAGSVKSCAESLHQHGRDVAGGSLLQIYRNLAIMHSRIELQNKSDVDSWCLATEAELRTYVQRMRQMLNVSLGKHDIESYADCLSSCNIEVTIDELRPNPSSLPVAWILSGRKS